MQITVLISSEQALHILVSWKIFKQLLVMIWVVWCIAAVLMILTECISSIVTNILVDTMSSVMVGIIPAHVMVALWIYWTTASIDAWVRVVILVRLRHSIRLCRYILLIWYLRVYLLLIQRRVISVLDWVRNRADIVTFGVFDLHWRRLIFYFEMYLLLLKNLTDFVSIVLFSL